ncbi:PAS domain S-box protein [Alteraurantiacibacter aquimixticola]|nr:PAS domain S-box protein [Alteraurantiacibacter aquimixticola]
MAVDRPSAGEAGREYGGSGSLVVKSPWGRNWHDGLGFAKSRKEQLPGGLAVSQLVNAEKGIVELRRQSLRTKILLLACAISLFTSVIMGVAASLRIEGEVSRYAESNVAHETRLIAQQFKGAYDLLENDAFVISRTPPIEGIIRSKRNGGLDPQEESTIDQWRSRLEMIFASIMEERPNYTQIRYIGIADGGRELVRVNRTADGSEPVPVDMLQRKGTEPYFQRASMLKPGEVYLSDVNYNREFGQVEEPQIPTIRVAVPIFSSRGTMYGLIVINADYRALLTSYFNTLSLKREVVITNDAGDHMTRYSDGTLSPFVLHTDTTHALPGGLLDRPEDPGQSEWVSHDEEAMAYSVYLPVSQSVNDSHIVVTARISNEELYAPAKESALQSLALSSVLVVVILCGTAFLATRMTRPLSTMTKSIEMAMHGGTKLSLPTDQNDEVGMLAIAFQNLIDSRNEHDARVQAVIDNVVDAIISIDAYGTVLAYNPASEAIFGYKPEEVVGQNIKLLMPERISVEHDGYLATYRETGQRHIVGITRELQARRKDGSLFPMELSVSQVDLSDGSYMFTGIVRDITERKRMEVMQGEFVSTVNHELRTPLTSIRASLGILQRRIAGKIDPKSEHLVDISLKGCERLGVLVNDILDLEKIAAGKMDFYMAEYQIGPLVEGILERHQSLAEINDTVFELQNEIDGQYCCLDASRFSQALINLLSNAAKFSPPGKPIIIRIAQSAADRITVSVADQGPGIPEAFRSKIFQRFAQADSSATRSKGGSGLGLNITKSIVEAFDGTIDFESVEGEGTTFFMTLPICAAPEEKGAPQCQAA